ncbi:YybH family protein [Tuwongella immobilis]|uniref:SnoaL-like domain-containing protein n=1 Tax=Tuwongella immobilis TaxID=692036 RepID=A0A6C2YT26_9BACT|nr:nuclear transport factor 2 family protein [Tuwongella immobilis]VIP04283.1 Uncharacterized protein OS=Chloracidobacterium thermophilum (strain B) GN=Cabther_A1560 PE=4 SV=1: DUF4440 [Tuwongella immobilis]VTS05929.1 Uncharacterized protein OS=Chloracidobacterium thermophilum (strain B) GN=Cabther_A1560 PE=4 SV=1: DUF4440 [Tuwongella immobilis]
MGRIACLLVGVVLGISLMLARGFLQEQSKPIQATDSVRVLLETQVVAWNAGNLDGFMQGYWNDPGLTFYSGNSIRSGFEETMARYQQTYQADGKEMGQLRFDDLRIEPIAPDTVFVRGKWHLTLSKESPEGLFTLIVKRFPHVGWKIVHDHTSKA